MKISKLIRKILATLPILEVFHFAPQKGAIRMCLDFVTLLFPIHIHHVVRYIPGHISFLIFMRHKLFVEPLKSLVASGTSENVSKYQPLYFYHPPHFLVKHQYTFASLDIASLLSVSLKSSVTSSFRTKN